MRIPYHRVFANKLLFHTNNGYAGFDETAFTSRQYGKKRAIETLIRVHGYTEPVVMIGDGMTDMEVKYNWKDLIVDGNNEALQGPEGKVVCIGYGGVVRRPRVETVADAYITQFQV